MEERSLIFEADRIKRESLGGSGKSLSVYPISSTGPWHLSNYLTEKHATYGIPQAQAIVAAGA